MKLLSLSGFIPEQICDTVRFTSYPGNHRLSHYCSYAADFISQVLEDKTIDGAVFPKSCDSCRVLGSYLSESEKFLYQIKVPARQDAAAVMYLAAEIAAYKKAVEQYYGVVLSDIAERSGWINERNRQLASIYESLEEVSYTAYLNALHEMLRKPLWEQKVPQNLPRRPLGKRVWLTGSFLSNCSLAGAAEHAGLSIVGDNLTESKRLFSASAVKSHGNIFPDIAKSILENRLSPSQNNFSALLAADLREMKQKQICGVIYATQKYCEPYDFLFSSYKKMLDENGIPVLHLSLADSNDWKNLEFAVEAFADTI